MMCYFNIKGENSMKKIIVLFLFVLVFLFTFVGSASAYYRGVNWYDTNISVFIPSGSKYSTTMLHAFQRWQKVTNNKFVFEYVNDEDDADVTVKFVDKVNGYDGEIGSYNLNVNGGHIRKAEIEIINNDKKKYSADMMFTTMLHEIGHILGLNDSSYSLGIMKTPVTTNNDITGSDIIKLYRLYGISTMTEKIPAYLR